MNWFHETRQRTWPLDPAKAEIGSLREFGVTANRESVAVRYRGKREWRCVPILQFLRETRSQMIRGRVLEIEGLKISPIARRRYARFFDDLTDWSEATRTARSRMAYANAKLNRLLSNYTIY